MVPFDLRSGAYGVHFSQKKIIDTDRSEHDMFQLCNGPSQMPPSPETSLPTLDQVNIKLLFLHSKVLNEPFCIEIFLDLKIESLLIFFLGTFF